METPDKKIDDSWKDTVDKEKNTGQKEPGQQEEYQKPDFNFFVTSLAIQASIALGIVANPITQKVEANLTQAKLLIDTMDMLKNKTAGNLDKEESGLLENALYELKMQYLSKIKGENK